MESVADGIFAGTIGVDTFGIILATIGLLNPMLAALIHVTSEMVFILNSARLLPRQTTKVTPLKHANALLHKA